MLINICLLNLNWLWLFILPYKIKKIVSIYLYKNEGQVIISFSVRIRSPTKFDILHNHYRKFKKIFIR